MEDIVKIGRTHMQDATRLARRGMVRLTRAMLQDNLTELRMR